MTDLTTLTHDELAVIAWADLGQFKAGASFPVDYNLETLAFYSPNDPGVHQVILWALLQADQAIVFNVYGFDDDEFAGVIFAAAANPKCYVQGSLDKSQAGGVHERKLLVEAGAMIGTSIAIGQSVRGAISHDKMLICQGSGGSWLIKGSTNWSTSGETLQDNELTITTNRAAIAEARTIMDISHDQKLAAMAKAAAKAAQ